MEKNLTSGYGLAYLCCTKWEIKGSPGSPERESGNWQQQTPIFRRSRRRSISLPRRCKSVLRPAEYRCRCFVRSTGRLENRRFAKTASLGLFQTDNALRCTIRAKEKSEGRTTGKQHWQQYHLRLGQHRRILRNPAKMLTCDQVTVQPWEVGNNSSQPNRASKGNSARKPPKSKP